MKKSLRFGCEAFNQDMSKMRLKNFYGLLPFGQEFDDVDEQEPIDWIKHEAKQKGFFEWLDEIGTAGI